MSHLGFEAEDLVAANVSEKVSGDVLDQSGNVEDQPASVPVALNAVATISKPCNVYWSFF